MHHGLSGLVNVLPLRIAEILEDSSDALYLYTHGRCEQQEKGIKPFELRNQIFSRLTSRNQDESRFSLRAHVHLTGPCLTAMSHRFLNAHCLKVLEG